MENAGISDICGSNLPPPCNGSNTPYMSGLANSYGIETQYVDLAGSSQPNYIGIMAATLNGCTSGCGANSLTEVNLVDRFEGAGVAWKAYMENQTPVAGCDNSDHGFYEFIHNPFVSFHDIDTNATRCNKIVLANPANNSTCTGTDCALINDLNSGSAPNFMWLTPNDCNNMHGNSACVNKCTTSYTAACNKAGDNYLSGLVPNILNSNTFTNTRAALFITFDEGNGFCPSPNPSGADCMYAVWAGPTTKTSFSSNRADTHYFFTKTIETNWGLATMTSNDAAASAMTEFFTSPAPDFSISASPPVPVNAGQSATSTITVSALNGFSGTVSLTDTIPSGLGCGSISPNSTTGSGTATVSCSATNAGNYTLTITGTSGSLVHTATALFQFRDFTITASPVTVNAGASGISTITVTAVNRFAGTVTLTDNVPSALGCGSITPSSITGSGTATVSCSAAISGNYTLTVTGTSGSLVHTAAPIFHVQDFGIAASSPAPVNAGSSSTSTITVSSINHFSGVVSLTYTIPPGLICGAITPSSVTGSGTATVSCSATVAGTYILTLTGTSGSLIHTATATFNFVDFTVAASSPAAANAGQSATSTITVTAANGFGGVVTLTDTVPSGLTCGTITPGTVTGSGTATVSCSATIAGNYTLTLTGTSGSLVHTAVALFHYRDFTISASSPGPVNAGSSAITTVTVTSVNQFGGTVSLTDTVPSGLTCGSITPSSVTGSGSATISCTSIIAGNYTLTLTGSAGSLTHSASALLQFRDFTVASTSPTAVNVGVSTTSTITVTPLNRFSGTVLLSEIVPPGLTCAAISPASLLGSGSATVSCSASLAGNYTLTITGSSTSLVHNTTALFQFRDFGIFASSPTPANAGLPAASTITITSLNRFAGTVSLTDIVPSGLTCGSINPTTITGSGTASISCSATLAGNYTLAVTGTSGSLSHTATALFRIQDFNISASSPAAVNTGQSATSTITINAVNGFGGVVTLTDTLPSGLTCAAIAPGTVASSGTATVSCSGSAAGVYIVALTGTSGTLGHSANATFNFVDFTITASSSAPANVGDSATSTITVAAMNGFAGVVNFTDSAPSGLACGTITPTSVTGSGTASVSCSAAAAGNYTLTVTGTNGSLIHSITVVFQFRDFTITSTSLVSANVGVSSISTLNVSALNQFSGTVSLTNSVPSGLVCGAISPGTLAGSGTATLSCSTAVAGNYTLTLIGTAGQLVHTAATLFQFWDFDTAASSPAPVNAGTSAISTIAITGTNHFNGVVSLTDTPSSGLVCGAITPSSITGSGTATVSCNATIAGNYTLTITGRNGSLSHSAIIIITVQDYGIVASPGSVQINAGSTGSSIITIIPLNNFSGTVSLSLSGTNGLTPSINPTTIPGGSGPATLTFSATAAGNYTITINSSSGTLTHAITASVQVVDFAIAASPVTMTLLAGATGNSTVTITGLNGFTATVSLTVTPSTGLIAATVPAIIPGSGSSILTVNAPVYGNYSVMIQATSDSLSHTIGITIHVVDYRIDASPVNLVDPVGSNTSSTLTLHSLNGYAGNVSLTFTVQADSVTSAPGGSLGGPHPLLFAPPAALPTVSVNPQSSHLSPGGRELSIVSVSLPSNLPVGTYRIIMTADDGTLSHTIVLTIVATDFSVTATPTSVSISTGSNATITLSLESLSFFQGNVNLTITSTPGGPTGILSSSIFQLTFYSRMSLNLTIQVPSNTPIGNYTMTIQAASGTVTHTLSIAVRVTTGGLLSMLVQILVRQNSASISAIAIFSLLAIFATLNPRRYPKQKSIFQPRRNKNHLSERSRISWYASYPLVPSLGGRHQGYVVRFEEVESWPSLRKSCRAAV